MKKTSILKALLPIALLAPLMAWSAGGSSVPLDAANNNLRNTESVQRGAVHFMNQCASCHNLKYLRYKTIAERLGWDETKMRESIMRGDVKMFDRMQVGMDAVAATAVYGSPVPDLSLTAKVRGTDWIYTYLRAYYVDENGQTDNYLYKGTAMPNVLMGDQGMMRPIYKEDAYGYAHVVATEPANPPKTQAEKYELEEKAVAFNQKVRDITNFLEFASEPNKLQRFDLGWKVIAFLTVLLIVLMLLKHEYWRDVK